MARRPRIRDDIANIAFAGDEHQQALETEAEASMWHRAVATRIDIPAIAGRVEPMGLHRRDQAVQALFTLAAADDLADAGHEHIHRRDGLSVVVLTHIEGLGGLRIVAHGHGTLEVRLGQIAFMLRLEVLAPDDRILELTPRLKQKLHRLGIGDASKRALSHEP